MNNDDGVANGRIEVFCPIDGKKIGEAPVFSKEQALEAATRARNAQLKWGAMSFEESPCA